MLKRNRELVLPTRGRAPGFRVELSGVILRLAAFGSWTVREAAALDRDLKCLTLPIPPSRDFAGKVDLSAVEHLDTAGAWLLHRTVRDWHDAGINTRYVGVRDDHAILLDEVLRRAGVVDDEMPRHNALTGLLADAGRAFIDLGRDAVLLTNFLGALVTTIGRVTVKPWRFRAVAFVHHIENTGLRALAIVSLTCLLVGAVLMQQGAVQLRDFGAEPFAVNMLGVIVLREVGFLLSAIMVAGRSGSAFTAEIGSMKMREEIDAMRALGIDPMETLILPRVLALALMLPLLTFVGDIMCFVGGGLVGMFYLKMDLWAFLDRLHDVISIRHFTAGMIKTPFAALVIALVGCLEGMKVAGSAESLGSHVTSAVVKSIFLVIILDALFALFLSGVGL